MGIITVEWDGVLEPDCVYRVYQDEVMIQGDILENMFEFSDEGVDSGEHTYKVGEYHIPTRLETFTTDVVVLTLKKPVPPSNLRVTWRHA